MLLLLAHLLPKEGGRPKTFNSAGYSEGTQVSIGMRNEDPNGCTVAIDDTFRIKIMVL